MIELYSRGLSEREMAKALNISRSTINLDVPVMRRQARTNVKTFVEDRLPFEHESLMTGIRCVLKKVWGIINDERLTEKAVANTLHLMRLLRIQTSTVNGCHVYRSCNKGFH